MDGRARCSTGQWTDRLERVENAWVIYVDRVDSLVSLEFIAAEDGFVWASGKMPVRAFLFRLRAAGDPISWGVERELAGGAPGLPLSSVGLSGLGSGAGPGRGFEFFGSTTNWGTA